MTIEEAAARLRKRNMTREQAPTQEKEPPRIMRRFAVYRIVTDVRTGEEMRRSIVAARKMFEEAQGVAMARNVSETSDDIFVVVKEEV
jgi:hypothetical protein